jgi:hypothetical protein
VVTRYEIEPAVGVKGSQIVGLAKDLARALSLVSIRVVETVPGKSCMALELPNPKRQIVRLSEIIGSQAYHDMHSPLTMAWARTSAASRWWPTWPRCRTCWWPAPPARASRWRQRDDPVAALQVRAQGRAPDHGRPEDAGTVDLRRHSAPAGAGGDRHEARPPTRSTGASAKWNAATS